MLKIFAAVVFLAALTITAQSAPVSTSPEAVASGMRLIETFREQVIVEPSGRLRCRGMTFWLTDVSLPRSAVCTDRYGRRLGCGTEAFFQWSHLFASGRVVCKRSDLARDQKTSCDIDGKDVALALLQSGWAVLSDDKTRLDLMEAQRAAKEGKRGVWAL